MTTRTDLSTPEMIMLRLEEIDRDLAERQNDFDDAAMTWFREKRDRERKIAETFVSTTGTVAERQAWATKKHADVGAEAEGKYEAMKAIVRVLETRAMIGMALLKSHGRA